MFINDELKTEPGVFLLVFSPMIMFLFVSTMYLILKISGPCCLLYRDTRLVGAILWTTTFLLVLIKPRWKGLFSRLSNCNQRQKQAPSHWTVCAEAHQNTMPSRHMSKYGSVNGYITKTFYILNQSLLSWVRGWHLSVCYSLG